MKTRGNYRLAGLLKKEAVRRLFAAALLAAPLAMVAIASAYDLYPGNGAAMNQLGADYPLTDPSVLISTPTMPSNGSYVNSSTVTFSWTGPSTTTADALGTGSYYLLEVSTASDFDEENMAVRLSTDPWINPAMATHDGSIVSTAPLVTDTSYYWRVAAFDGTTQSTGPWSEVYDFMLDLVPPSVAVVDPAEGAHKKELAELYGTATDDVTVFMVRFTIEDESSGQYWNGGAWQGGEYWNAAVLHPSSWTYAGVPAWVDGSSYTVVAKALDPAGNESTVYSTSTFHYDTTVPVSFITAPEHGAAVGALTSISGTADDVPPGELDEVRISYYCVDQSCAGNYWNSATGAWDSGGELFCDTALAAGDWSAAGASTPTWATGSVTYRIFAKAVDLAGNETIKPGGPAAASPYIEVVVDGTAPDAVSDMDSVTLSTYSVSLNWTAPGDDGASGTLNNSTFTIQYSTYTGVAWSTSTAQVTISTTGVTPGVSQYYTLPGLSANTSYYFRMWTVDKVGNYSALSNGATSATLIEEPTSVYIDEVGTTTIVASAYAPGPAFTGMENMGSGVAITTGTYDVWGSSGDHWTTKTAMTTARYHVEAAAAGGKIYVIGGNSTLNYEYDPVTNGWAAKAALPSARTQLAAAAVGGKVYVVGGEESGVAVATNNEYDPVENSWRELAPLPAARKYLAAAALNGKVYALGGDGAGNQNEVYDPVTNAWETKANLSVATYYHSAVTLNGKIYVVGGTVIQAYDPVGNNWVTKTPMPTNRWHPAAGGAGGKLYVIGGTPELSTSYKMNEMYDPGSNTWTDRADMTNARYGAATAVVNGRIYVIGGYNSGVKSYNEEYTPGVSREFTGLQPNTMYTFKAKARNQAGIETGESSSVSTYTLAAVTLPEDGPAFGNIDSSTVTVTWSSGTAAGGFNGPGASYRLQVSTSSDFFGNATSSMTYNLAVTTEGLSANTTYFFRVQAYNAGGMTDHGWLALGSTVTLANPPAAMPVLAVTTYSATAQWGDNGNTAGAIYWVEVATDASFYPILDSSDTQNTSAEFTGLSANTTYFFQVAAYNSAGVPTDWVSLGSTVTLIEAPTSVYVDEVSTTSIVASAYAPSPAFTGMERGDSAVAITTGTYDTWGSSGNYWTTKAALGTARYNTAAAEIGGKLYLVGGDGTTTTNQEYDPAANSWATKASKPSGTQYAGAAAVGGRMYVIGGYSGGAINTNHEYDPVSNNWAVKKAMPTARYFLRAGAIGGKIYAVGGLMSATTKNEEYDPVTDSWATKASLPYTASGMAAAVSEGKLYVFGAYSNPSYNKTIAYNPVSNSWVTKANMPTSRMYMDAGALGGKIYVLGGYTSSAIAVNEEYDPAANSWATRPPLPTKRRSLAVEAAGGRLYAIGGQDSSSLKVNEEYTPGVAREFTGLAPNTQYTFKAKARNQDGTETGESPTVSTYTLAAVAFPQSGQPLAAVYASSATIEWSSGTAAGGYNGPGASYKLQISTSPDFLGATTSSTTYNLAVTPEGLSANTTYYFRVQAYNAGGMTDYSWLALGSTVTHMEAPTSVYVDEVTTTSIVASAYAPGAAFSGMERGDSAVAITTGTFDVWGSSGNYWTTKLPMPTARAYLAVGTIGGKLYAIGGTAAGELDKNEQYDPVVNSWATKTAMPTTRSGVAVGAVGGKLYALGGYGAEGYINEEYDPEANSWATKAPMPTARQYLGVGAIGGKLYAVGGHLISTYKNENEEYDPVTDAWTAKADMPTARRYFASGVMNGKLYAVGGSNGSDLSVNEEYDPVANTWDTKAPGSTSYGSAGVAVGGKLYVLGGYFAGYKNTNRIYDPSADAWTTKAAMPTSRRFLAAGVINGRLFAVGGDNGSKLNSNEEYNPGLASVFSGLIPNTQYTFKAKARNLGGTETSESASVSTYTLAAVAMPQSGEPFSEITAASALVSWSSGTASGGFNGPGAGFLVVASTSPDYLGTNVSSYTYNTSSTTLGLSANTSYYFRIQAYNAGGMTDYSWLALGSTVTLANPPVSMPIVAATTNSITAEWDANGNGAGTLYNAQISSSSLFTYISASTQTANTAYPFSGLPVNTSYYIRVNAINRSGTPTSWTALPSTYTVIEAPASVYVDEVGTTTIVASAYAATPAFTRLEDGQSATNVAIDTDTWTWAGWHSRGWNTRMAMLTGRANLGVSALNGRIYAIGGAGSSADENEVYDPLTDSWTSLQVMPTARNALGVAAAGGKVYAVGSDAPSYWNQEYDPLTNSWTTKANMPTSRGMLGLVEINGKLYAVGGYVGGSTDVNEEYDPQADSWTSLTAMTTSRQYLAAAVVRGKLYALGGASGGNQNEEYTPGGSWATRADLPTPRERLAAAAVGGKIYAIGGSGLSSANEEYDPLADTWTVRSPLPTARTNLAAAALFGRIYVMGGTGGTGNENEEFDPGVAGVFTGLTPNTLYTFKAKARNLEGQETEESVTVSTYTLATVALPDSGQPISMVNASSVTVAWSSGTASGGFNGPGASYKFQVSVSSDFLGAATSSTTYNLAVTTEGLSANTTYFFRVQAYNAGGMTDYSWLVLGSTVTRIEAPTSVYVDEVTTTSIVASAYAPSPAFTGMELGDSAVAITTGTYDLWGSSGNYWSTKDTLTSARRDFAAASLGGRIYAMGGYNSSELDSVEEYDPALNNWTTKAALPEVMRNPAAAAAAGRVYIVRASTLAAYDPASNTWEIKVPIPTPMTTLAAASANGRIYAMGGNEAPSANLEYDPASDTWTSRAAIPTERYALGAAEVGGRIYAVGGYKLGYKSNNEEYDPVSNTWTAKASISLARSYLTVTAVGGKLHAMGGYTGIGTTKHEIYDPQSNSWISGLSMPIQKHYHAAAAVSGIVYTIGGFNQTYGTMNRTDAYTPGVSREFTGLAPNTQYSFKAKARNQDGAQTGDSATVSTYTLAAVGLPQGGEPFAGVSSASVVVAWSSGTGTAFNGPGASFLVTASTSSDFLGTNISSYTYAVDGAELENLYPNTTYYFRVQSYNAGGMTDYSWLVLGSTITRMAPPTDVYVDSVTTTTIITSAYAAGGFPNLAEGLSGIAQAIDGVYGAWWQTEISTFTGLMPNTQYTFKSKARSQDGVETEESVTVSTYTLAAVAMPQSGEPFSGVYITSVTVEWSSGTGTAFNGVGAAFRVEASTSPDYVGTNVSSYTYNVSGATLDLQSNTSYYFRVQAYNAGGVTDYSWLALGSTVTLVNPPLALAAISVGTASITAAWDNNGNAADTLYVAEAASDAGFGSIAASSDTLNTSAVLAGLPVPNTYYFLRVKAINRAGSPTDWVTLDSTATAIETPTSVYLDEVGTTTIVASAYAPSPAFTGIDSGDSAVSIAKDGSFDVWGSSGNYWETKEPMNTARYGLAAAASGGKIYAIGGYFSASGYLDTNEEYDPASNSWVTKTAMPTARRFLAAVTVGGRIYAVSGYDGLNVYDNEEYDPVSNTWAAKAGIPTSRYGMGAAAVGGKIYVVGGMGGMTNNEEYDPASNSWATKTPMSVSRYALAAAAVNGKIYAMGGYDDAYLADNEEYDPITNAWSAKSSMPTGRESLTAAAVGGKIYAMGGLTGGYLDVNEVYDPATDAWTTKEAMPAARAYQGAAVVTGKIYVLGGLDGATLATNEVYIPGVARAFSGLTPNTQYAFKSRARNRLAVETSESAEISTYTLAAVGLPPSGDAFAAVYLSSAVVAWSSGTASGGYNAPGASFRLDASTAADYTGAVISSLTYNVDGASLDLSANTTYHFRLQAYNSTGGTDFSWLTLGSTSTEIETPTDMLFTAVSSVAVTVQVEGDPGFTNLGEGLSSLAKALDGAYDPWLATTTSDFTGLTPNTQYSFSAKARNVEGRVSPEITRSTWTLAEQPGPGAPSFPSVYASSISVSFSPGTNPAGTTYYLQLSTAADFSVYDSTQTVDAGLVFTGLLANTTYYGRVAALSGADIFTAYTDLGNTVTLMEPPTDIYADAVTTTTITATAYAPGGFPNLDLSLSGIAQAIDGVYGAWVQTVVSTFTSLTPNTQYALKAKARNQAGVETSESVTVTTYTLAAAALSEDGITFPVVYKTSVTVAWSSGTAAEGYNGPGASFTLQASTAADFTGTLTQGSVSSPSFFYTSLESLGSNTTYHFRILPYNAGGMTDDNWLTLGTTVTHAIVPGAVAAPFGSVTESGFTAYWNANGNAAGTSYRVQLSSHSDFSQISADHYPVNDVSLTVGGSFESNTTHYARVAAVSYGGVQTEFHVIGATVTLMPPPTDMLFTAVSSRAITAQAYSAQGFPNLTESLSGMSIALNGGYAGWTQLDDAQFTGLVPNTSYVFKAKARNQVGIETDETPEVSTYTLAAISAARTGPVFSGISTGSAVIYWSSGTAADGFNGAGAAYRVQVDTAGVYSNLLGTSDTGSLSGTFYSLWPNTTHYFRGAAFNSAGVLGNEWLILGSTSTLANPVGTTSITVVYPTSATLNWTTLPQTPSSSTCEGYLVQASTAADFTGVIKSTATGDNAEGSLILLGLFAETTYHLRVGALNHNGVANYLYAGSTWTPTENLPPTITDNESATDYIWYGALPSRTYDVDFHDTGGSALENFQLKAASAPVQQGILIADWTDILTAIDVDDYTADWSLAAGFWDLLADGTNYISVRVFDGAGNTDSLNDAFVVFKDSTAPAMSESYDDAVWRSTYGFSMDMTVTDPHSRVDTIQGAFWTGPNASGTQLQGWTDVASGVNANDYTTDYPMSEARWDLLADGTNYMSLRAWDYSVPVNTNTWVDSFLVLKDTTQPEAVSLTMVSGSTYAVSADFSAPVETPSGITEFAVQFASFTVAWSTYAVAGTTHVYASTSGVQAGDPQSFLFDGLEGNTTYYTAAWTKDLAGNWSAASNEAALATLAEAPAYNGDPQFHFSSATARWTGVPAAGFRVEVTTDSGHNGTANAVTVYSGATTSLDVAGLSPNTTYYMRVASLNWSDLLNYGSTYMDSTFAVAPASSAPYALVSSVTVTVEWLSNGNGPGTRYSVEASSDNFGSVLDSTVTHPAGAEPYNYTFEGLSPNTTYWFNVLAIGNHGDADQWISLGSTVTTPVPPTLLSYDLFVASASVTWDSNGNGAGTVYQADLSTAADFSGTLLASTTASEFSFDMGPLTPNTSYYLRLRAVSAATGMASLYVYDDALTLASAPGAAGAWTVGPNNVAMYWGTSGNPGASSVSAWTGGTALPEGLYGHAAAIAGNLIFITGGYDGSEYKAAVWSAPLSAAGDIGSWTRRRDMPGARYAHGAVAMNGRLFVVGGYDGVSPRSEVWSAPVSSDGALGEWVSETPLPQAVYAFGLSATSGLLYVAGGYNSGARDNVWYTGVNTDGPLTGWTAGTALPEGAYSLAAAVAGGDSGQSLYIAGGWDSITPKAEVRRAPINGDGSLGGWTAEASLPSGLYAHSITLLPGALAVSGGNGGTLAKHEVLLGALASDGSVTGWTNAGSLPSARQSHVMAERAGRLIVLGGYDGLSAKSDSAYAQANGTEYTLQVTGTGAPALSWMEADNLDVGGLTPNSSYSFTAAARNCAGTVAQAGTSFSTYTYAAQPSSAAFSAVFISSAQANWVTADNPGDTVYEAQLSSDAAHAQLAFSSSTTNGYLVFTGIDDDYTYYARVRAVNAVGIYTPWTELNTFTTRADPALDFSSPTITNNQSGDNAWRNAAGTLYDLDFADTGGAWLASFQVRAATYPAADTGAWTDVQTSMNAVSYDADWELPSGYFGLLPPGTSYISVRAWDGNGNSTTTVDAFYVLKDTAPPVITDGQSGEESWRMDDAGAVYDVDFEDDVSGLAAFEYSASTHGGMGDASAFAWTPVVSFSTGLKSYTADWAVDFAGLINDATSYISVRAWDLAGNTVTVSGIDVFKILKYVSGPEIGMIAPAAPYHSALAAVSGTSDDSRSHAAHGVEVSVLDTGSGKYWDGAEFLATSRKWFTAAGTAAWTYNPGITWPEGGSYQVVARSSDTSGNYSVAYATASFTFDSQAPELGLTSPQDGATVVSAAAISGTSSDISGVAGMALRFSRLSDGYWWDFNTATWTVSGSSAAVAPAGSWTFTPPELLQAWLASGASYYYTLYAVDSSSPALETAFHVYGATFSFADNTAPAAIADLAASTGSVPGYVRLNWTAPGDDGAVGMIRTGEYRVQYSTWSGVALGTASAQVTTAISEISAGSARTAEITNLVAGETYYLHAWTLDDAGNWSALSNGATSQAAPYPDQIAGHVTTISSAGITGVLVEAFDASGLLQGSSYTIDDGSGSYLINGLPSGSYLVQATWESDGIISSVGSDSIPLGASNADFTLSISYELASIGGELPAYALSASGFRPRAAASGTVEVQLFQRGRMIATAPVDKTGHFLISSLLPGKYTLRVPEPAGGYKELEVRVKAGEAMVITPLGTLLKKDSVYVYPNPAAQTATFHIESDLSPVRKQLAIFDITGKLVGKLTEDDFGSCGAGCYEAVWNVPSGVASGVYMYSVHVKFDPTGEHKNVVRKFAIVK